MTEYAGGAEFFDVPPLRYMGSKWMLADWIIAQFPSHDSYVEPYCGGAAVFFRKMPSRIETLNDLDGRISTFFRVLRNRTEQLVQAVDLTPYSRAEYDLSFVPADDELEQARRFYVQSRMAYGGAQDKQRGWRSLKRWARHSSIPREWSRLEGLLNAAYRLKHAQVECRPAIEVIREYDDPKTLFYIDPPYLQATRRRPDNRYRHEMDEADHVALAEVLHSVRGYVVLSGYQSELYARLYTDWRCLTKSTTTNGNSMATECLWLSPSISSLDALPMFAGKLPEVGDAT